MPSSRLFIGRDIAASDLESAPRAAVINETMARRYFGARNPLGSPFTLDSVVFTIVGVVGDFQSSDVREKPDPEFYYASNDPSRGEAGQAKLFVHIRGEPSDVVGPIVA